MSAGDRDDEDRQQRDRERRRRARRFVAGLLNRAQRVCNQISRIDQLADEVAQAAQGVREFLNSEDYSDLVPEADRQRLLDAIRQFENIHDKIDTAADICSHLQDALDLVDQAISTPPPSAAPTPSSGFPLGGTLLAAAAIAVAGVVLYFVFIDSGNGSNGPPQPPIVVPAPTPTPDNASVPARPDTDGPELALNIFPPDEPGPDEPVLIEVEAKDIDSGMEAIEIYVDSVLVARCEGVSCSAEVGPFAAGVVSVLAVAFDLSGNEASQEATITVEMVVDPIPTDAQAPELALSISPIEPGTGERVLIEARGRDADSGMEAIEIYVDGALVAQCGGEFCSIGVGPFSPGVVSVLAVAFDLSGNETSQEGVIIVKDAADFPPLVQILRPQDGAQVGDEGVDEETEMGFADVSVEGSANDPEDGVLGGDSLIRTTNRSDLQDAFLGFGRSLRLRLFTGDICSQRAGTHQLILTATDSAGNASAASMTVVVRQQVC